MELLSDSLRRQILEQGTKNISIISEKDKLALAQKMEQEEQAKKEKIKSEFLGLQKENSKYKALKYAKITGSAALFLLVCKYGNAGSFYEYMIAKLLTGFLSVVETRWLGR